MIVSKSCEGERCWCGAPAPGTTLEAAFAALDRLPPVARAAIYEATIPFSPIDCEAVMRRNGLSGEELAAMIRSKGREIMAAQARTLGLFVMRRR